MKSLILILLVVFSVGCSTAPKNEHSIIEGAKVCNNICKDNPEISEISVKAGGGMPLLFIGGMEKKCACRR